MICNTLVPQMQSAPNMSSHKRQQGGEHSTYSSIPYDVPGSSASSKLKLSLPSKNSSYSTLLQTTQVEVKGPLNQKLTTVVIFDLASDRSYVTSRLVQKSGLQRTGLEFLSCSAFGGEGDSRGK